MATVKQVYSGDDLMIFDATTNKSWAWAQSHSLSVNIDVVERNTKDNPKNPIKELSKINYEITTENLFCEDFNTLFAKMITGEYIDVKFGKKKNEGEALPSEGDIEAWTLDGEQNYFVGKFIVSSLQSNAATGQDATYTATFTGCNRIEQKNDVQTVTILAEGSTWTQSTDSGYRLINHAITEDTRLSIKMTPSGEQWVNYLVSTEGGGYCWGKSFGNMPRGEISNLIQFDNDSLTDPVTIKSVTVRLWFNVNDGETHEVNILGQNEILQNGANYMTITRDVDHVINANSAWSTALIGLLNGDWCNAYGIFEMTISLI